MIRVMKTLAIVTAVACGAALAAAADPAKPDTDKLFKAVAAYEFGQDEQPLIAVAELVRRSHNDPKQRRAIEDRLIQLLDSGTPAGKRFVCRQLWMAASARSVGALVKLLADKDFADAARYALERMADPAAGAALRDAAGKAKGRTLVGLVNSLGQRRDKPAAALLIPLLADKDPAVAAAAAWSLGRIGGADAARALTAARAKADGKLRRVLDDACLLCADTLLADGKNDAAAAIYRQMYAAQEPRRIRIAALRGSMLSQPKEAGAMGLAAMKGPDRRISAVAAALLRELPGEAITKALAAEMPKLPPAGQVKMLAVLARRGDASARPAVLAAVGGKDKAVRVAAVGALGRIGTAKDVPLLVETASKGPAPLRSAAQASLVRLGGPGVEEALTASLKSSPPSVKAEVIRVLSARWATGTVGEVVALASDKDPAVRAAALAALGRLAGKKELPALLALLAKAPTDADRAAAGKALASACVRIKDKRASAMAVLGALKGSPVAVRCALLRLLVTLPAAESLAAVRAATKDPDAQVRDAAARALTDWPTADVVDDLLALAAAGSATHKVLAVRGCVRALALPADRSPQKTAALYARLMKLAGRTQEKKLVLAGLADVGHVDALKLVRPLLTDPALRAEAQTAAVRIARAVAGADYDLATATLEKIAATAATDRIKKDAAAAIRHINQHRDYILTWMLSGPYTQAGKSGSDLFNVAFAPEKPDAKNVRWRLVTVAQGVAVDLKVLLGGENRAAYLRTTVISPRKQAAVLELGSDDGVKAWLGGKLIHANNASRSFAPGADKVKITLQPGENTLLLEIINGSTDWAAAARIIGPDGKRIAGLKVVAK